MSGSPLTPPLKLFLRDLVALRTSRGLTHEALHGATKLNIHLIDQFERTGLVDHPLFNDLYQRAILRSYATLLQEDETLLVTAFDEAIGGVYRRELAVAFLGMSEAEAAATSVELSDTEASPEEPETRPAVLETVGRRAKPPEHRFQFRPADEAKPPQDDSGSAFGDWVGRTLEAGRQWLAAATRGRNVPRRAVVQWAGIVAAIAVAITLIVQFVVRPSAGPSADRSAQQVTLPAPTEPDVAPEQEAPPPVLPRVSPADIVLGDSIRLIVVAERNRLDPFRVQVDRDLRRPYWLNQGDTMAFLFADRITVQDRLADMTVLLDGLSYPLVPADTSGRVIISRDSVREFLADRRSAGL